MNKICFIAIVASLSAASVHAETKKPASKWTCEEFLAVEGQFQPKVIYWASAQSKAGKPATDVDIEGTEKVVPMVIDECNKAPQESFWAKLKRAWKKVESDAKALGKKL